MKKNNCYKYPKTQREKIEGKRHYVFDKEKLPSELMLQSLDQSEFNSRIDKLLEIPQEKYVSLTESARKYFMNIDAPYPHKVIYKDIERCVKEGY